MAGERAARVLVIGLDGAAPPLVFDRFKGALPALGAFAGAAISGELESTLPATSVPAWPALVSGRDPGELGLYGPRQRTDHSYAPPAAAGSRALPREALWDVLGAAGGESIVLGLPPGYPPLPLRGLAVADALTPPEAEVFTAPPELSGRIRALVGRYEFDLRQQGPGDPEALLARAAALTRQRFGLLRALLAERDWRLALAVDPTLDRLQHAYWHDPALLQRHYALVDEEVGRTLEAVGPATVVAIVSEHGARASRGGFAVNDWLAREGYLCVEGAREGGAAPLERAGVDWRRTAAWAEGGPAVRLMLNVQGREPEGTVEPRRYEALRNEIKRKLEALAGPDGKSMGNRFHKPEEVYQATRRVVPDLIGVLGGYAWRAVGAVGHEELFLPAVEGVSSGGHAEKGLLLLRWPRHGPNGRRQGLGILDLYPTLLTALGLPVPERLAGRAVVA